ncbi:hypothetical protein SADUNF_Sadunf03G0056400 [Salix dunnii]|uniref:Uncharacterized protein n=1 Tax=Salix dunnii TaxID=1413687 RepID=A0A835KG52_9ROSI|nr:hypothetical protein SADUNF_Sadunf03G0056400 [Salix dunnii]
MEENDPFVAITKLCQVSASQEQHLNHCPFALEPQTNDEPLSLDAETPVASTAITMVSPPQTPVDNHKDDLYVNSALQNDDVFTTPPEEPFLSHSHKQHGKQVVEEEEVAYNHGKEDRRDERTVTDENIAADDGDCEESSREMDLGFTVEAGLTERIEIEGDSGGSEDNSQDKEVTHCKYMKGVVLKRVLVSSSSLNNVLGESSSKRSKLHGYNLGLVTPEPSLRTELGKSLKRLVKSWDKFKWTPRASVGAEPVKYDERLVRTVDVTMAESKRSKPLDKKSVLGIPNSSLGSDIERRREDLGDSVEKLCSEGGNDSNRGLKSLQNEQVGEMVIEVSNSDRECGGESSAKRKLQFSTELIESEFEETDEALRFIDGVEEREANTREEHSARKSLDDLDKFRYAGPANVYGEDDVTDKRVLPASVHGRKGNEGSGKGEHDSVFSEMTCMDLQITLLDVLKILAENEHSDPSLGKLSILDAAKIGGMTFP